MKTYSMKAAEVQKDWIHIDAKGLVLGRLAALIANVLRGKNNPQYTPHVDCGAYVVVTNAKDVVLTGKKRENKVYYKHTGYPGGLKEKLAGKILDGRFPERVLLKAVERMLPKESPLARKQLTHLHVYGGAEHPHQAQQPKLWDVASLSRKNTRNGGNN